MVAEMQGTEATTSGWQSAGTAGGSSAPPALRLLARVPRVGGGNRPAGQMPGNPWAGECEEAKGFAASQPLDQDMAADPNVTARSLIADRVPSCHASASPTPPAHWVSRLCKFHASIAPYAGMIVALALLASAGLLYWLVMGPVLNSSDPQQQIGQDMPGPHSPEYEVDFANGPVWSVSGPQSAATKETATESANPPTASASVPAEAVRRRATPEVVPAPEIVTIQQVVQAHETSRAQETTPVEITPVKSTPVQEVASQEVPQVAYPAIVSAPATPTEAVDPAGPAVDGPGIGNRIAEAGPTRAESTSAEISGPTTAARTEVFGSGQPVPRADTPAKFPSYPRTQFKPFEYAQSDASDKNRADRPRIASRPKLNPTGSWTR